MTDFFTQLAFEIWQVMLSLSPSLFLGMILAGLLHVYLPAGLIRRRLSQPNLRSVIEASLLGVPMPLCSCGVVPTAIGLKNEGASKGAATSFLISTPQTGVDSILVSASFLGWPFALFKVVAAFVTGIIGGSLVNATVKEPALPAPSAMQPITLGPSRGIIPAIRYGIFDLLAMIDLWIIAGVVASALIAVWIPEGSLNDVSWLQGITGMLVVLGIALPLYVCTTGSVPIAASLIAAGMPLGSALVFLMAGPATNVATMGAVLRALGGRVLAIYLATVAGLSILFGLLFDFVLGTPTGATGHAHLHGPAWIETTAAIAMSALLLGLTLRRLTNRIKAKSASKGENDMTTSLKVEGMTCQHCVANVKKVLEADPSVESAQPDLASGLVTLEGLHLDLPALAAIVEKAGYKASPD